MRYTSGHHPGHTASGVMTVFFTLLSVIFLGLFFMLIESVRYRGAHAQTYLITDLGTTSVFAEYEPVLLKEFDLLSVDASYGTGDFSISRVEDRLETFLQASTTPDETQGLLTGLIMSDPWQIALTDVSVSEYALLSDGDGEYFYQQVVAGLRQSPLTAIADRVIDTFSQAEELEKKEESYKAQDFSLEQEISDLEKQEQDRENALIHYSEEGSTEVTVRQEPDANPLDTMKELMKKDPFTLICPNGVSSAKVGKKDLCSGRKKQKGTLALKTEYSGLVNDLYFREYLMDHFQGYTDQGKDTGALSYELEYLLNGQRSDRGNLKLTVLRLVVIREALNYLYCVTDSRMSAEAAAMATVLVGWTGVAPLVAVCKHALLLGWAFGESLLDVRTLMCGGKVPLVNSSETWILSLENMEQITGLLKGDALDRGKGPDYRGYLRLLLYVQSMKQLRKRGLDLVELRMRTMEGEENFRADYCVIALKDTVTFSIPPLWSRVTGAFLRMTGDEQTVAVEGGFAYDNGT